MKGIVCIFLLLVAGQTFAADPYNLFTEAGKYGLKNESGEVLIPAQYDALGWSDNTLSLVNNSITGFMLDGKWGLISTENKIITGPLYVSLLPGDRNHLIAGIQSAAAAKILYGCILPTGKTIIPFQYDEISITNNRYVVMRKDGNRYKYGLLDEENKVLIPSQYRNIYPLGNLRYAVENFDRKTALFSENGVRITDFSIDSIGSFANNVAVYFQDGLQGLINREGMLLTQPAYREIVNTAKAPIAGRIPDKWEVLDFSNTVLQTVEADHIAFASADRFLLKTRGSVALADNNFKPIASQLFDSVSEFKNGIAVAYVNSRAGAITSDGSWLLEPNFDEILPGEAGFILTKIHEPRRTYWELYDATGTRLTRKGYQLILPFSDNLHLARQNGFWGVLDKTGNEIIPCVYDSIYEHRNGQVSIRYFGKTGIITLDEEWLVPPSEFPLGLLNADRYFEFRDSTWFLKSFTGEPIYFSDNPFDVSNTLINDYLRDGGILTINLDGVIVSRTPAPEDGFEKIEPLYEGLRLIKQRGKFGFVDSLGRLRIANRYEDAKRFTNGFAPVKLLGRWGYINRLDEIAVQPVYDEVFPFEKRVAIVRKGSKYGLIDVAGREVLPIRYDRIELLASDHFLIVTGDKYGLTDNTGNILLQPYYDQVTDLGNGYAIVASLGKSGVVSLDGLSVVPPLYDELVYDRAGNRLIGVKRSAWQEIRF